jgi:murein DD-endopeptidase MepM/ murein hydrolase activator NlpD
MPDGTARIRWAGWALAVLLLASCGGKRPVPYELRPSERIRGVYHTVERGQTLWRICKAYGVDMQTVAEVNNIRDVTQIRVGQRIFIPGATRVLKVEPYRPSPDGRPEPLRPVQTFEGTFIWPVHGSVTSSFGVRNGIKHSGIDIAAPKGTPVRASAAGEVAYRGTLRGYGKILILKHSSVYTTVYAHLGSWEVREGQKVRQGQIIGTVGNTGRSSGPHLHFEIRKRNKARNPLFFLSRRP